jgi:acetyl esterase/lipase
MKSWIIACASLLPAMSPAAGQYEVVTKPNIEYVEHDGTRLTGDLYMPRGVAKAPIIVSVHGGGWQNGSPASFKYWGPYLAKRGFGTFAIKYRLGKPGMYPKAVYDVKSAIQFVRAKAADLGADPDRIGLSGDSAGGHLVTLVGLAADEYKTEYRNDPNAAVPANVKTVVGFYGVYDLLEQWHHDQIARPRDQIAEKFLGASPMQNRKIYFESSPISYATVDHNRSRFFLINGTADDIVSPSQSQAFWQALNAAGIYSRRVVLPGVGHFFSSDPFENEPGSPGAVVAPRMLRFLEGSL